MNWILRVNVGGQVSGVLNGAFKIKSNLVSLSGGYISTVLVLAGVLAVVYIMIAGFNYLTSAGDDGKAKKAKEGLRSAIFGLIYILLAYGIVRLVRLVLTGSPT